MLRFQLFGQPQISYPNKIAIPQFRSRKIEALLYYLVANSEPQRRTHVASMLWSDVDDKKAASNLRYALWNLRQVLPELEIDSDRSTIELKRNKKIWVDAVLFQELPKSPTRNQSETATFFLTAEECSQMEELIGLYQGEFLDGFEIDDAPLFDEWLNFKRSEFHSVVVDILDRLGEYYSRQHQLDKALEVTSRVLNIEPWREESHRQMMLLLALNGERIAALSHFEGLKTSLQAELNIEPAVETVEMMESIRTGLQTFEETREMDAILEPDPFKKMPFFGRETEYGWLIKQWEAAAAGKSGLIMIEGESGSGKSRLIQELSRYAIIQGALVVEGRCFEFNDPVPYQPIFSALQPLLAQISSKNEFRRVDDFDEVLDTLTDILEFGRTTRSFSPGQHINRYQLFEITQKFLQTISAKYPILLFMDDLQWSDSETLDLLSYLVRRLTLYPVLIIGACRPGEAQSDHPLVDLKRPAYNEGLDKKIILDPLPRDQIKAIVQSAVCVKEVGPLSHFLSEISQGNLFIVSDILQEMKQREWLQPELDAKWKLNLPASCLVDVHIAYTNSVHILCDSNAACGSNGKVVSVNNYLLKKGELDQSKGKNRLELPDREGPLFLTNTKDRFRRRIARLSHDSQNLLAIAAVFSEPFNAALLESTSGLPLMVVLDHIEEWMQRKLIIETRVEDKSAETAAYLPATDSYFYEFSHQLIQVVLYDDISNVRRQAIHLELGNSLESFYHDRLSTILDRLAYHFHCAAHAPKALKYLRLAGRQALEAYILPKASECFQLALAYWGKLYDLTDIDVPQEAWQTRWDILLSQSEVSRMLGQLNDRFPAMDILVQEVSDLGDEKDQMQVIHQQLAEIEFSPDLDRRRELAQTGIVLAEQFEDEIAMGFFLQAAADCDRDMARHQEALIQYEAALDIFSRSDETVRERAFCLVGIGKIHLLNNRYGQALALFERASALAKTGGHQAALIEALNAISYLYRLLGSFEASQAAGQNALNLCEYLGFESGASVVLVNLAYVNMLTGNLGQAKAQLKRAWGISEHANQTLRMAEIQCALGHLYLYKQQPDISRAHFVQAENLCDGFNHSIAIEARSYRAMALLAMREMNEARVSSHHAIVWMIGKEHTLAAPQCIYWNQYQVLLADGEAVEAQQALVMAYGHVQDQLSRLPEAFPSLLNQVEIQTHYLTRLKWNQEIVTSWEMLPLVNSRVSLHRVHAG